MNKTIKPIGLYIHVPFCEKKCPYCDFYSKPPVRDEIERYTAGVKSRLVSYAEKYPDKIIDTVYFGGGTPSLIGGESLSEILLTAKSCFKIEDGAEITTEANPHSVNYDFFRKIRNAGFNRLSLGLQSANEDELKFLGRQHNAEDVKNAVRDAESAGFDNISLDLMIGLPNQTEEKISKSIDFCASLGVQHISSYILKIEENTVFYHKARKGEFIMPDDDRVSDLYLFTVNKLAEYGYNQYEISNFTKPEYEGRHNLHYWRDEEYLGIGPAAHSFTNGKRFYYGRNLKDFLNGAEPTDDGKGGSVEEKIMLKLRLTEGLSETDLAEFPDSAKVFKALTDKLKRIPKNLIRDENGRIFLTPEGFLVSNSIIGILTDL